MNKPYTAEDVDKLYRLIGQSVWHLQHLENILASYIVLCKLQKERKKGDKITQIDLEKAQLKERKKTLDPLIKTSKAEKIIPSNLSDVFDVFLEERNWLIHKCVINEYLSLRNEKTKKALYQRINSFIENAVQLRREIHQLFELWFSRNGYNLKDAYGLADQKLADAEKSQ